ncbi:1,4-dihydroxy-2-naphthoate polyprenyltransferase [Marihabitans asiaticum]|uniref:1,4-dihydroxy-2-naphthoate octaprenyltransferase n=1 Tax=Marihabitans asiaticum TaxID=415218 RepID=A0A560WHP8_9MICO|nr:1,4-dihydroxy-2-naphthoate polyprenyltransferase [Marihabitans asiaticum]TWD17118.1 1,4-dihydroxy-2-naphthoate prenyltransferase [Marihabitans asiaticum]
MATLAQWIAGSRPRTLPAAVAPVVVGTAAAAAIDKSDLALAVIALVVAVSLQIGVNYANDYSDGVRGTDEERVGPVRLVGQRLADPENVKLMAFGWFGVGALAGLALVALAQTWILVPLGALAILAAWRYTGGDNPYGYRGLGEVYVFVFFGLMAVLGTQLTQAGETTLVGLLGAIACGALTSAILVANNLRDIPTDRQSGKHTLAVRLGDRGTRTLYLGLVGVAVLCTLLMAIWHHWAPISLIGLVILAPGIKAVVGGATGRALIPALATTGMGLLAWSLLLFFPLARG